MKDGDLIVEQFRKLVERRDRLYNWFKVVYSREYTGDWLYWMEFTKISSN
jgi:hypothetical protein